MIPEGIADIGILLYTTYSCLGGDSTRYLVKLSGKGGQSPMGNITSFKKVLAIVLAATCMLVFSFGTVFAADEPTASPTQGKTVTEKTGTYAVDDEAATASFSEPSKLNAKSVTIEKSVSLDGTTYKVTGIDDEAFAGAAKLKVLKIKSPTLTKVSKTAFKGLKKSQIKKIKVKVTKKMSKKNFKVLKKALKAAGIKAKNVKRNLK